MNRNILFSILLISLGLLSAQWAWPDGKDKRFSEKVNLALRQVGHQLLTIAGDQTSTIVPVKEVSQNEYMLRLENELNYDTLPHLLDAALRDFDIEKNYHVAIRDCETDRLILGYQLLSFQNKEIACLGREQRANCNKIHVVFEGKEKVSVGKKAIPVILGSAGILFFIWNFFKKNKSEKIVEEKSNSILKIGKIEFDHKNQTVKIAGQNKSLTFRENKLLHFFMAQPDQVLEREKILSEVWGDEGVIVGRSLDVFVSRLRKIIKEDESLKIKNVHGVGYRLETGK